LSPFVMTPMDQMAFKKLSIQKSQCGSRPRWQDQTPLPRPRSQPKDDLWKTFNAVDGRLSSYARKARHCRRPGRGARQSGLAAVAAGVADLELRLPASTDRDRRSRRDGVGLPVAAAAEHRYGCTACACRLCRA